jgi:hypothetical protein
MPAGGIPNAEQQAREIAYRIWLATGKPEGRDREIYAEAQRIARENAVRVRGFIVR